VGYQDSPFPILLLIMTNFLLIKAYIVLHNFLYKLNCASFYLFFIPRSPHMANKDFRFLHYPSQRYLDFVCYAFF